MMSTKILMVIVIAIVLVTSLVLNAQAIDADPSRAGNQSAVVYGAFDLGSPITKATAIAPGNNFAWATVYKVLVNGSELPASSGWTYNKNQNAISSTGPAFTDDHQMIIMYDNFAGKPASFTGSIVYELLNGQTHTFNGAVIPTIDYSDVPEPCALFLLSLSLVGFLRRTRV